MSNIKQKFHTYKGEHNANVLLAFIRHFDLIFRDGKYKESAKIKFVALHLEDITSIWWTTLESQYKEPKSWNRMIHMLHTQFLPAHFK